MGHKSTSREPHHDVFVLSGGANRGAVQVGMMECCIEHGIVPDALVGTSVGALNAAFMGLRPDRDRDPELRARWMQMTTQRHLSRRHPDPCGAPAPPAPLPVLPCRPHPADRRLAPAENLEDLPTPVRVVTTPLAGRQRGLPPPRRPRTSSSSPRPRCPRSSRPSCCRRAAATPACTSTAASPTWCRSAARRTWRPPACSSSTRASRRAHPRGVRPSTSWSPVSGWRPGCGPARPGPRGRRTPVEHP